MMERLKRVRGHQKAIEANEGGIIKETEEIREA